MMSDSRRHKIRHRGRTYVIARDDKGKLKITYTSPLTGTHVVNALSQIADELRAVKPEAFAAPPRGSK